MPATSKYTRIFQRPHQDHGENPRSQTTLSGAHWRMLFEGSGIDPGVAAERGYYTARSRSEVPEIFPDWQRRLGLVVPMFSPDGTSSSYQLRPNRPRKAKFKYESPAGSEVIIDVHPRMREEIRVGDRDLWIVEGVKKADALVSRGIPAVALAGVWMAHVTGSKGEELLPCWRHVRLSGRRVIVGFDSDWQRKAEVHDALQRVVKGMEAAGADIRVCYLEDAPDGSKVGVDDYLVAGGTVTELRALCRKFEPADIARIRLSRDERLRLTVEDVRRRWWDEEWKGRGGHSDRDVALVMIRLAAESGKVHPDGLRVKASWGVLQVEAKVSRRTLAKALSRLEERGVLYRDNEGRKRDEKGAFVLRAKVDQGRERPTQATTELRGDYPGGLPSRAPSEVSRLRWPRPKWTPRRGTVRGTRKVRESKPQEPRDRIERLGKIRGAVVDALVEFGGSCTLAELCEVLRRSRPRDLRRRVLPMLEEAGIIGLDGDVITLAPDWSERLDDARDAGGEIEADELAERDRQRKSHAYRGRNRVEPDAHPANGTADGFVEDLRPAAEPDPAPQPEPEVPVSPLAAAVRDYLDRAPHDACQPAGWIGSTLWALELYDGKPTPAETDAAIEELGGERYLRDRLRRTPGAA